MVQDLSVGQSSTSETEAWRCSGSSVSCKSAHESQVVIHAESDRVVPNSNVTLHVAVSSPTQQSTVDHTHQPDIRSESASPVNPVILSNTAKLVVDSGCFDHCCPLEFATQSELNEGRFLSASSANTIKLKHYGTRVVEGWTRDVSGTEIPLNIKFNVFDVKKSPLLSTNKLPKTRVYSLVGPTANNPEKQRHHDRVDRPERVADTGAETREQRRCAPRLKRSARRHAEQLQCACPGDPQALSDELTNSITCRTDLGANTA